MSAPSGGDRLTPPERHRRICAQLTRGADGIWSAPVPSSEQRVEVTMREQMAAKPHVDYIRDIARHHSVPVMDREVARFLARVPKNGAIVDVGGCWGWHWRHLSSTRPDVTVVIVDFVRGNLQHAKRVLGPLIETQVALVHGDATALPFDDGTFDAFWTVQTFQHIPDFAKACQEAYRVMRGGPFACYSLHATPAVRVVYGLMGRTFHLEGQVRDAFYLARANDTQRRIVGDVFHDAARMRYSECLFHPDLRCTVAGVERSVLGWIDARLSDWPLIGRWLARQCAFEARKAA